MHIQVINFNLDGITPEQYEEACDGIFAPMFAEVQGLISKVWLSNTETGTFGGVYSWENNSDMDNYLSSELFASVKNHPNLANVKSLDFGILESATRVTRGIS